MASPEVAHTRLELVEALAGLGELHLEEFCRARGLALAHLQILLDVEGGERVGDLRHDLRIRSTVGKRESRRGAAVSVPAGSNFQVQLDVPAHAVDELLALGMLSQGGIE